MAKPPRTSTSELTVGTFAPHGSMDIQVVDRLNVLEAHGPFNLELVRAANVAQEKVDPLLLTTKGAWGTVLIFRHSALISQDALTEIGLIVRARADRGIRPTAVALVFGKEVEGAGLMNSHYQNAYASAGIPVRCFEAFETAKSWVAQEILKADELVASSLR